MANLQEIWGELVEVEGQELYWKKPIEEKIPFGLGDKRANFPEVYVVTGSNGIRVDVEPEDETLNVRFRRTKVTQEYSARKVSSGIDGLFATEKLLPTLKRPDEIILVGSYCEDGIKGVSKWTKRKGWQVPVIVVDSFYGAIKLYESLENREPGYFGIKDLTFLHSDITSYLPSSNGKRLVIGDILNAWMIPSWTYSQCTRDPFKFFVKYLKHISLLIENGGQYFGRCAFWPAGQFEKMNSVRELTHKCDKDELARRIGMVETRLGSLASELNVDNVRRNLTTFFSQTYPNDYCGLGRVGGSDNHAHFTLESDSAREKTEGLHINNFGKVNKVQVLDESNGVAYQSYLCSNRL